MDPHVDGHDQLCTNELSTAVLLFSGSVFSLSQVHVTRVM